MPGRGTHRRVFVMAGVAALVALASAASVRAAPTVRAAPSKRTGWMTKQAYERRPYWTGKRYMFTYPLGRGAPRPAPIDYEPWVFRSAPPDCPKVYGESWQGGMLPYLLHAADEVGADFLERREWPSVRATGRKLRVYWPDYDGQCHTWHADFVEVEYTSARPPPARADLDGAEANSAGMPPAAPARRSPIDSPAWRSMRDIALSWCGSNPGKCPDAAVRDLRAPPSAKGAAPGCPGTLEELSNTEVKLTTWNCNGGTTVRLARVGSGWSVSKIVFDQGGD